MQEIDMAEQQKTVIVTGAFQEIGAEVSADSMPSN
jgi:short-subunit dehydrogenase